MTIARTLSCVTVAVDGHVIDVEAHVSDGLVGMNVTGLADASVNESRDRVRAAVLNTGARWPQKRITVGLSPAWLPKHGSGLDLAIATAILAADDQIRSESMNSTMFFGELALDGRVRPVRGTLIAAMAAARQGCRRIFVAAEDCAEAALVSGIDVVGVTSLAEVMSLLGSSIAVPNFEIINPIAPPSDDETPQLDFSQVKGQPWAKFALEVAAAGGHHLAMLGSPGVGKTLLASRLPSILPPLDEQSALEVTAIASVVGRHTASALQVAPPFAAPHHTASYTALVGGGSGVPVIGMVTQAHRGILFLDEAPEFATNVLDALRQPLESKRVILSRRTFTVELPANFQLVIAANPCPCGYSFVRDGSCYCTPMQKRRYLGRISGPLLDRIDIRVVVDPVSPAIITDDGEILESSEQIRQRVTAARQRARNRLAGTPWSCNADVPGPQLREMFSLSPSATSKLSTTSNNSARGVDRIAKVAWSVADLRGHDSPTIDDVDVAQQLRNAGGRWAA